jgi:DNA repair exonuclease SbcCD ATPase subunit
MEELEEEKRKELELKDTEIEAVMHALAAKETDVHNTRRDLETAQKKLRDATAEAGAKQVQICELQTRVRLMEESLREADRKMDASHAANDELQRTLSDMRSTIKAGEQNTHATDQRPDARTDKRNTDPLFHESQTAHATCGDACKVCGRGSMCMVCGSKVDQDDGNGWGGKQATAIFSEFSDVMSGNLK